MRGQRGQADEVARLPGQRGFVARFATAPRQVHRFRFPNGGSEQIELRLGRRAQNPYWPRPDSASTDRLSPGSEATLCACS